MLCSNNYASTAPENFHTRVTVKVKNVFNYIKRVKTRSLRKCNHTDKACIGKPLLGSKKVNFQLIETSDIRFVLTSVIHNRSHSHHERNSERFQAIENCKCTFSRLFS